MIHLEQGLSQMQQWKKKVPLLGSQRSLTTRSQTMVCMRTLSQLMQSILGATAVWELVGSPKSDFMATCYKRNKQAAIAETK